MIFNYFSLYGIKAHYCLHVLSDYPATRFGRICWPSWCRNSQNNKGNVCVVVEASPLELEIKSMEL